MINFIIINWFNWSGVWIWVWFRVKINWRLWIGNFNVTFINVMMIKSPRDSWNHRVGFGRRGPGFEVSCWRLDVPLYWWFIWFITMKCIGLINLSPKIWWGRGWTTNDAGIILLYNSSTVLPALVLPQPVMLRFTLQSFQLNLTLNLFHIQKPIWSNKLMMMKWTIYWKSFTQNTMTTFWFLNSRCFNLDWWLPLHQNFIHSLLCCFINVEKQMLQSQI